MLCSFAARGLVLEKSQGSFQQDRTDRTDFHPWLPQAKHILGQRSFWCEMQDLQLKTSRQTGSPPPSILEAKWQSIESCYKLAGLPPPSFQRLTAAELGSCFQTPVPGCSCGRSSEIPDKARCPLSTNLHNYSLFSATIFQATYLRRVW